MVRYCLKYQVLDVALSDGDFVVGRIPECDLVLDDGLVSRRHARFSVAGEQVKVEDLGSRNGVLVNGQKIAGPTLLSPGDEVQVGGQNLLLKAASQVSSRTDASRPTAVRFCERCHAVLTDDETCPRCSDLSDAPANDDSFEVLNRLVNKALHLGRTPEAERIAQRMYDLLLDQYDAGLRPTDADVAVVSEIALRIAARTGKGAWLDCPLRLHQQLGRVVRPAVVDRLFELASRSRYNNPAQVRAYLDWIRPDSERLDASQRFSLSRLEGLARMLASH